MKDSLLFFGNDEALCRLLYGSSKKTGTKFKRTETFPDFLEELQKEPYSLLLIDTDFSDMTTEDYGKEIRKFNDEVPVLYFGSFNDQPNNLGFNGERNYHFYITKPINPVILIETVNMVLRINHDISRLKGMI